MMIPLILLLLLIYDINVFKAKIRVGGKSRHYRRKERKTHFHSLPLHKHSHLDIVLCDLDLRSVDVVDQFSQGLSVHLSDLHLMGLALTHVAYKTHTVKHVPAHSHMFPSKHQCVYL